MKQATVKTTIEIEGIGVHSGKSCRVFIEPAPENSGITYIKVPYDKKSYITADYRNVSDTTMCTRISNDFGATVSVIEHISAAFCGLGITNAIVKTEGDEIPFLDGSARGFVEKIKEIGIEKQSAERKKIRILKEVKIGDSNKWASIVPAISGTNDFIIDITCDYSAKGLKTEPLIINLSDFEDKIASARTFGFFSDVEYLRRNGLAIGASLENTVVFDEKGEAMNPEGLRYPNEPVVHKVLDIIGDISLAQCEIIGCYKAFCPGHNINNLLLRELFKNEENFEVVSK